MYFHTKSPRLIDFTCRQGPNFFHDLVFLASYIHDARIEIDGIRLRGKTLQLPMERDRWERFQNLGILGSIPCRLTISSVLSMSWQHRGKTVRKGSLHRGAEFTIRHVYLGESYWDDSERGEIILSPYGKRLCKLRIAVSDPFVIHLEDCAARKVNKR